MSKKKLINKPSIIKSRKPEFSPGDKPYLEYDGVVLNANVPWNALVDELIEQGCIEKSIAQYAECSLNVIKELKIKKYDNLCFRAGARIITLHYAQCLTG
jgi:hypothetical protein